MSEKKCEPYIKKEPRDPLKASDWNNMQVSIKKDLADMQLSIDKHVKKFNHHNHDGHAKGLQIDAKAIQDHVIEGKHIAENASLKINSLAIKDVLTASDKGLKISKGDIEIDGKSINDSITLLEEIYRNLIQRNLMYEKKKKISLNSNTSMTFILIPAGTFKMGSNTGHSNEAPEHLVTIRHAFYLGKYPVTQEQWKAVMETNPNYESNYDEDDKCPIDGVSWNIAQEFIKKLNGKESNTLYQLPSEAQWEYACRAGTTGKYFFGNDDARLDEYAWHNNNSGGATHSVGQKKPNPWGLYDMYGNICEWMEDIYHQNYKDSPEDDSAWVTSSSSDHPLRGGSFCDDKNKFTSTYRSFESPDTKNFDLGFRLLRKCQ